MSMGFITSSPDEERANEAPPVNRGVPGLDALASRETRLWRMAVFLLLCLAVGLALISWPMIRTWPRELEVLPFGLVVLVLLFGAYAISKTREMAELRGLVRGLEQRATVPPDLDQLEKLFGLVQRSQQGYRDLIDTFEDLLFSISAEGKILAANKSFADLLGLPFGDLVGRNLDDFVDVVDGDGRSAAQKALPRLLERRHWSGVLRLRLKGDVSTRFFRCTVHALVRDGQERGLCVLARDITRDRENEARFTELFETLREGVYLASADGKFESVNPEFARVLGYEIRDELLDRSFKDLVCRVEEWESEQRELAQTGSIRNHQIQLRRRDNSEITCLHAVALIRDTGGRVRRRQGTLVDITEHLAMEQRLHREQEFARRLVESFPDLVVALDRDGHCTFVSPRSKELLGFTPEEMVGTRLGQRTDPHDRKEVRALLESIFSGQSADGSLEFLLERRDGEMRLFRASASPLFDAEGNIDGVIASARDITEAKRMEQQLIQTERLAAMGQMIAGVAHELNNPLTAILGVTELLRDANPDEGSRRQLDLAHRQARRAAQIVQSLLSFSRPPQPRKMCLHLSDVIERSLQLHEHSLRTNHITVDFVPRPDLPTVLGDTSQLTQVFLNLITNAEQAIREVREHGTLRIRLGMLGDRVIATFHDDGVGIRRDILPRIFDPFFTTKRPGRGTGLGLSICLAILREHNGQIEGQPNADGGSVFTVSLPIARGTETFLVEPVASEAAPSPPDRLLESSVLVVDDEESIRELVRDGLTARRIRVDVAASGAETMRLLEQNQYDAVLCDLNLQSAGSDAISGRDVYMRVAKGLNGDPDRRPPFFLFMTGELVEGHANDEMNGMKVPMLQKPFRISELIALLSEGLSRRAHAAGGVEKHT
jgi:PAS domain S-box-containing protein